MRISVEPASRLETDDVAYEKEVLSLRPVFYGKGKEAGAVVIRSLDTKGKLLKTFLLKVSGVDGELWLEDLTHPVPPAMEQG